MMIIWWSKRVVVILSVLVCEIWINVLLQTSALVGPLYIVIWNARWNSEIYFYCFESVVYISKIYRQSLSELHVCSPAFLCSNENTMWAGVFFNVPFCCTKNVRASVVSELHFLSVPPLFTRDLNGRHNAFRNPFVLFFVFCFRL
jgi:hypothetical protein